MKPVPPVTKTFTIPTLYSELRQSLTINPSATFEKWPQDRDAQQRGERQRRGGRQSEGPPARPGDRDRRRQRARRAAGRAEGAAANGRRSACRRGDPATAQTGPG